MNNFYHGRSMQRVFRDGDILLTEEIAGSSAKPGDVIIFQGAAGKMIVHRVIRRDGEMLTTMGDNNSVPDSDPVDASGSLQLVNGYIRSSRRRSISRGRAGIMVFRWNRLRRKLRAAGGRMLYPLRRIFPEIPLGKCRVSRFGSVMHYEFCGMTVARQFSDGRVVFTRWYWRWLFSPRRMASEDK